MAEWQLLVNGQPIPGISSLAAGLKEVARLDRRVDLGVIELRRVDFERRDNAGVTTRPDREHTERNTK